MNATFRKLFRKKIPINKSYGSGSIRTGTVGVLSYNEKIIEPLWLNIYYFFGTKLKNKDHRNCSSYLKVQIYLMNYFTINYVIYRIYR